MSPVDGFDGAAASYSLYDNFIGRKRNAGGVVLADRSEDRSYETMTVAFTQDIVDVG